MITNNGPAVFPVKCAHCAVPVAEIQGDTLVIISRHFGDKHTTVIPLAYFQALAPQGAYFRLVAPLPLDSNGPPVYSQKQ